MFFLASCVTLLRSWHGELARAGTVSVAAFFLRRFFRIAPAYYLAAIGYWALSPTPPPYPLGDVIRTVTFTNALHPEWALTDHSVVPGGWSVGVEAAFYVVFPIFAAMATSLTRSVAVFAGAVVMAGASNVLAPMHLSGATGLKVIENGLFFWFPNQAPVFALGGIVYFVLRDPPAVLCRRPSLGVLTAVLACVLTAYLPFPKYFGASVVPPAFLVASLGFSVLIVALSGGALPFVNPIAAGLGRVSFSAYLLHFGVIEAAGAVPALIRADATGWFAIVAFAVVLPGVILVTYALSWVSFRLIERPMIELGRAILARRPAGATTW